MSIANANDGKFFSRGKVHELASELQACEKKSDKSFTKRKTVLKKIVANMTLGNDMSALFVDVVSSMSVNNVEIKKMIYLYLINYGKTKPDEIHLAIRYFTSDCEDRNPLIRGLALRTMSYIALPAVTAALVDPLRHCLTDSDPYVRKTAAICVAKIWMHDKRVVEREGFIAMLRDLLADNNASVVANAVASLSEITERSEHISLKLNLTIATKLISAVSECSEWGQIYILDSLLQFVPQDSTEAEIILDRIVARLQHTNSAVVLTTIKIMMYMFNYVSDQSIVDAYCKKLSPPLVTLLSSGPEVQYVTLRNILLIIQRRPVVLQNDVKVFFIKYNEPTYVKLAKLEIMYRLANESNYRPILLELTEYATEVDVDFVRKSVRSIGRLAIKVTAASDRCVEALLILMKTRINYVLQEAIVVIRDIFRRYPNRYEGVIGELCENLDSLDEPEAKAAMIWIIGQYADRIENASDLLDDFLYKFLEEPVEVQLSLLTATVKLFIKRPNAGQDLVPKVLKWATEEVDNPDLRDRGFIYWRLLSTDPAAAKDVVLSEKPPISTETDRMDRALLDTLLLQTGTISSIYHKTPESFIRTSKPRFLPDSPALDPLTRKAALGARARMTVPLPLPSMDTTAPAAPLHQGASETAMTEGDGDVGGLHTAYETGAPEPVVIQQTARAEPIL